MVYSKKIFMFTVVLAMLTSLTAVAGTGYMTITLPEDVVLQSVRDALPLPISTPGDHVEGTLVIDSISRLAMKEDTIFLQGQILGRNIVVSTRIGNQDIRLRVGEFRYPLRCNLSFRYDPAGSILYITPHLVQPEQTLEGTNAGAIVPVLALLDNREYKVSLAHIQGFSTEIGQQKYFVDMEPVDVRIAKSQVVLKMIPRVNKK